MTVAVAYCVAAIRVRLRVAVVFKVDTFEKSARKPQRTSNTDVSNASAVQALDINISGTSSTPASGAGDSSVKKRTRRNAPSLQSLLEIPPTIPDNEYQPVVTESSNNELVPPSDSNEAMVCCDILILTLLFWCWHFAMRPRCMATVSWTSRRDEKQLGWVHWLNKNCHW